jgi:hypothetical protein
MGHSLSADRVRSDDAIKECMEGDGMVKRAATFRDSRRCSAHHRLSAILDD